MKRTLGAGATIAADRRELIVSTVTAANEPRLTPSGLSTRAILDTSATVTLLINRSGIVEFESAELARLTGWPAQACIGKPCFEVLRVNPAQRIVSAFGLMLRGRLQRATFEFEVTSANGDVLVFLATLADAFSVPDVGAAVVTAQEISRRKAFEIALRHNANHDSLTGLFNRRAALRQINRWIAENDTQMARPAVLLLDIDGFKAVNDVYGHAVGDAMLVALAHRLSSLDPANVGVARLGVDELLLKLSKSNAGNILNLKPGHDPPITKSVTDRAPVVACLLPHSVRPFRPSCADESVSYLDRVASGVADFLRHQYRGRPAILLRYVISQRMSYRRGPRRRRASASRRFDAS